MKKLVFLLVSIIITSCIPVNVAPKFKNKDYKIIQAKKFKRKLPRETSFIFKDPKNDGEFYDYINYKYKLNNRNVGLNTSITIEGDTYYLTYSETDKNDTTLNILPVVIDAKLESDMLSSVYTSRKGHWYIIITVYDNNLKNCLIDKHPKKDIIVNYLKALKKEYLSTGDYKALYFKK